MRSSTPAAPREHLTAGAQLAPPAAGRQTRALRRRGRLSPGRTLPRCMRWTLLLLALAVLLPQAAGCRQPVDGHAPKQAKPPHIIFILIDALRADRVGCFGGERNLTPTIDQIAAEGVCFERTIAAAPWTQPSVASLFCSCYPEVHKVQSYGQAWDSTFTDTPKVAVFSDAFTTLAEMLQQQGYQTAAFSANPFVIAEYGYGQGFEHFDSSFASFTKESTTGAVVNDAVGAWLAQRDTARPTFLYLHYMDVHGPYEGDPEFLDARLAALEAEPNKHELTEEEDRRLAHLRRLPTSVSDPARHERLMPYREYWEARYEAGVRQMDNYLAALRQRLEELGVWQNAYVIVAADHGEALCEHHYWDHGLGVHDNQLHVPLILRWPGVLPAGRRVGATVRLIDVLPTIADQFRLAPLAGVQGISLLPHLQSGPAPAPVAAFAESVKQGTEQKALYSGRLKVMYLEATPPRLDLFDIVADPHEQRSIAQQTDPRQLRALLTMVQRQMQENATLAATIESAAVPIDEAQRRRLESLGYFGSTPTPATQPASEAESDSPPAP